MTSSPTIPREQRAFAGRGGGPGEDPALSNDRRDTLTGVQSPDPGDADVNLDQQGRFGNLKQNLTARHRVQDR